MAKRASERVTESSVANMAKAVPLASARREDCPAAPVCRAVGNLRKGCLAGGPPCNPLDACLAGLVLAQGWPLLQEQQRLALQAQQSKRVIGFHAEPPPGRESRAP